MTDCLFCKIINGELPSTIVYENRSFVAFEDIDKQAPVHILIVPKVLGKRSEKLQPQIPYSKWQ